MYGSMAGVGRISEGVVHMGSDNPTMFYCIIHQEALCCKIFFIRHTSSQYKHYKTFFATGTDHVPVQM
jgi:hypothetical protein